MENHQPIPTAYQKPVTLRNVLSFAVPTIAMTMFISFYTMVDGLFVSNLIGSEALSAINLTAPVIQLVKAREDFTFLILVNVLVGFLMCGLGYLLVDEVLQGVQLSAQVAGYCQEYLDCYLFFTVPILLMNNFALYLIASGKSMLSFLCSLGGGVTNLALDALFLAGFHWGIGGAAIATGLGYSITAVVGLQSLPLRDVYRLVQRNRFGGAGILPFLWIDADYPAGSPCGAGRHGDLAGDPGG